MNISRKTNGKDTICTSYEKQNNSTSRPCLFISFTPFLKKIMAPRGPRSDLWVVVVTTSAYSKGEGITPAATNPLICAISANIIAFCLSQTCGRDSRCEPWTIQDVASEQDHNFPYNLNATMSHTWNSRNLPCVYVHNHIDVHKR